MKLSKKLISMFVLVILINNAFIESNANIERNNNLIKKIKSKTKEKRNKSKSEVNEILNSTNAISFFIGFMTCMPFIDVVFSIIETIKEFPDTFAQCKQNPKAAFENKLKEIYDETVKEVSSVKDVITSYMDNHTDNPQPGASDPKKWYINNVKNIDPKILEQLKTLTERKRCQKIKEMSNTNYKDWAKDYMDNTSEVSEVFNDIQRKKMKLDYLWNVDAEKDPTCGFFEVCKPRKIMKKMLVSNGVTYEYLKGQIEYKYNGEMAPEQPYLKVYASMIYAKHLFEENDKIQNINCNKLPDDIDFEDKLKAAKPGFIAKAKATWAIVSPVLACFDNANSVAEFFAPKNTIDMIDKFKAVLTNDLFIQVSKIIANVLFDFFGLFLWNIVQVLVWIYKGLMNIYDAIQAENELKTIPKDNNSDRAKKIEEISKLWGKAAGCGVRFILVIIGVRTKKRKSKRMNFK